MNYIIKILITFAIPLLYAEVLYSKPLPLFYKDFVLGENKKNILSILSKQKYSRHLIFHDSNDRFLNGIKVKAENSIKIIIKQYMEREEILLVFNADEILFDIYTKKKPADIRDFIDQKIYMSEIYGKPADEQVVKDTHILVWSFMKRRYAVYLLFDSINENLIINMRDTYLNMKYEPVNKE